MGHRLNQLGEKSIFFLFQVTVHYWGKASRNHSGALFTDSPPARIRIPKASTAHIRLGPPMSILMKKCLHSYVHRPIWWRHGLRWGFPFSSDSSFVSKIQLAKVSCELVYFHSCLLSNISFLISLTIKINFLICKRLLYLFFLVAITNYHKYDAVRQELNPLELAMKINCWGRGIHYNRENRVKPGGAYLSYYPL